MRLPAKLNQAHLKRLGTVNQICSCLSCAHQEPTDCVQAECSCCYCYESSGALAINNSAEVPRKASVAQRGIQIELFSALWMLIEFTIAVYSGIAAHSLLLAAFGLDSLIELVSGIVLIWRLNLEQVSEDRERIERAEQLSSRVVGIALMLLAVFVTVTSIVNLLTHHVADASLTGIILATGSCLVMPLLMVAKRRIAGQIGSAALAEDGMCNLVCAYMAFTVLVGAGLTALFGWWWADAAASLILVYFIAGEGWEAFHPDETEN